MIFVTYKMLIIGLLVLIWVVFKEWRMPNWFQREPKMTALEKKVLRRDMKLYLRKYPNGIAANHYPDLMDEIQAVDELNKLDRQYRNGNISAIDFEIMARPLIDRIDVNELSQ